MTFLAKPLRYNQDDMVNAILAISTIEMKPNPNTGEVWSPAGVCWHNTAEPSIDEWMNHYSEAVRESWGANYDAWCKTVEHWHSGPHICATPSPWSVILCDLQADGIHSTCYNEHYYGVETIGDFAPGKEDPLSGPGALSVAAAANVIAALCVRFNWDPHKNIVFHRDCPRDGHPCPGAQLTNDHAIELVVARIVEIKAGITSGKYKAIQPATSIDPNAPIVPAPLPPPMIEIPAWPTLSQDPIFFNSAAKTYNKWKSYGVSNQFALAMVAQAEAESAFKLDANGDHKEAYGIYQWHWSSRGEAILKGTGIDLRTFPSLESQIDAAWWEFQNTEKLAFTKISACTTANNASIASCIYFEGAGAPNAASRRGAMAERWADFFTQNPSILTSNLPSSKYK
jgi:hypothetical protein